MTQGKKVALLCRTKASALVYAKKFENFKTEIFTSETPDAKIKAFERINIFLQDVQLLIMTSKVTVGADIQVVYDNIFVDFKGDGCTARDILQMCGRFRQLNDTEIMCLTDKNPTVKQNLEQHALDYLYSRKNLTEEYVKLQRESSSASRGS